jgi:hypothetical protein
VPADVGNDRLRSPMTPSGLAVTGDRRLWIVSAGRIDVLPLSGGPVPPRPTPPRVLPAQSCDITGDGTVSTIDAVRAYCSSSPASGRPAHKGHRAIGGAAALTPPPAAEYAG